MADKIVKAVKRDHYSGGPAAAAIGLPDLASQFAIEIIEVRH
jgi:hypothetical protein